MTKQQRTLLAGLVGCDVRTVERWLEDPTRTLTGLAQALEYFCRKKGFELPAPPETVPSAEQEAALVAEADEALP